MSRRNVLLLTMLSAVATGVVAVSTLAAQRARPARAPVPDDAPPLPDNPTACNYQEPIDYLVRENFLPRWTQPPEEQRRRRTLQKQAVEFRTKTYGYFEGFGNARWNRTTPSDNATRTRFMDLNVRVNEKIVPVLECVEQVLRSECGDSYTPGRLSGLRTRNTYHNNQVSNHVYGIAVDVDPRLNTCCMCVAQWGDHPLCQNPVESIYDRMAMPSCWVHVFERFGFYWLGRDRLQDTMHFEFLGDPDHVLKTAGTPPHMQSEEPEPEPELEVEVAPEESTEASAEPVTDMETTLAESTEPMTEPEVSGGCGCSAAGV